MIGMRTGGKRAKVSPTLRMSAKLSSSASATAPQKRPTMTLGLRRRSSKGIGSRVVSRMAWPLASVAIDWNFGKLCQNTSEFTEQGSDESSTSNRSWPGARRRIIGAGADARDRGTATLTFGQPAAGVSTSAGHHDRFRRDSGLRADYARRLRDLAEQRQQSSHGD